MPEPRSAVSTLVVGIGSTIRGDDGVGVQAAERLKALGVGEHVDILALGTAGLSLLEFVEDYSRLIILDAIVTGAAPGTIHELRGEDVASTVHLGGGHEADLPTTLAFSRRLSRQVPEDVVVIAIEAGDLTTFSESLTPEVDAAIPGVLARVRDLVGE